MSKKGTYVILRCRVPRPGSAAESRAAEVRPARPMLTFLRIRNFAIVRDLALRLGGGLNLLTGETGAGKSILVDALGIALGDRASSDLVRAGAGSAEVEAIFALAPDGSGEEQAGAFLASLGIAPEDGEVIVRREIELQEGEGDAPSVRTRQFLCDTPVSLATLKKFADLMVEIQGQHQHHALLGAEAQREALDRFAGAGELRAGVRRLARAANEAEASLAALGERAKDRDARLEFLRFQIGDLDALAPSAADERELRSSRALLASAARRTELAERAYRALYEDDGSALALSGGVRADLRSLSELDPALAAARDRAEEAARLLEDVALELRGYREAADLDPARLEEIEERLARYDRLARRHGIAPSDLGEEAEKLRAEAASLERHEESLAAAGEAAGAARKAYLVAAKHLSSTRRQNAERLAGVLRRELASLAMERCEVVVEVLTEEPRGEERLPEEGIDRVTLCVSPNPGEPPRPLAAVASGGELSRLMLAVNGAFGAKRGRRTLIFDEVDAGIGGRIAAVVGERLRSLAAAHQVVAITHLPQIASLADRHFVVEKRVEKGRTIALVRELDQDGRVAELARMMGGKDVSPIARRHAAEMLRRSGEGHLRRSP